METGAGTTDSGRSEYGPLSSHTPVTEPAGEHIVRKPTH